MSIDTKKFVNFLLGTSYENGEYYIEKYDIGRNFIHKELIDVTIAHKEKYNIKNENINNNAFCFECKKNINLELDLNCKKHNIKNFRDLIQDINIEKLEENLH